MRFTLIESDAHDTAAARQLAAGFRGLRFSQPLEAEFRKTHRLSFVCARLGPAALLGLVLLWWLTDGARALPAHSFPRMLIPVAIVFLGSIAAYAFEYAVRVAYLEALIIGYLGERDGLTRLFNRRMFDSHLERIWRQSIDDKALVVLMFIDVDNFRSYNDRFGLRAGDECIQKVALSIAACAARPLDFCARYTGIQFAIVLANPDRLYAEEIPEKVRSAVAALQIPHPDSPNHKFVTLSVGVALTVPRAQDSREAFAELAQAALREAHEKGGDRVRAKESETSLIQTGMFRAEVTLAAAQGR
jgi:diguanylate cyclase (GGDEF)-like protein